MKVNKDFVLREIAGDYVLVPIGETMGEFTGLFAITDVGARIWELIPECETIDDIINILLEEYEVERDVLTADVDKFLAMLGQYGITVK